MSKLLKIFELSKKRWKHELFSKRNLWTLWKTFRKSILAMNDTTFYSVRLKSFIPYEDADDKEKELLYEYELIIESYFNKKYSNMFFE